MGAHDNLAVFSDAQAISAAAASTNYIDMGVTKPKIGIGARAPLLCIRTNAAPTDANDTISIELQCDSVSNFASPKIVMKIGGADAAELVVGTDARLSAAGAWVYRGVLPYECDERYVRLYYRNGVSNGVVTLDAWLEFAPGSDNNGVGTAVDQVINSPVGNP